MNAKDSRNETAMGCRADVRPWEQLRDSGLLWLINRQVFHPRGYALALIEMDGQAIGWQLLGDGREAWRFADEIDEDALLAATQALLAPRPAPEPNPKGA